MTTRKQLSDLYDFTIENIDKDLQRKLLSQTEAKRAKQAAFNEYQEYLAEFEGVATLDEEEIIVGNEFGQALVDIADENDWDLQDLAEILGADPDYIEELISDEEVPDDELIDQVVDIFDSYQEEEEAYDDEEDDEDEELEESDAEETEEASYSFRSRNQANFSDYQARKVQELEEKVLLMEREKEVIAAFNERQTFAAQMVANGDMPPAVYNYLIGSLDGTDNLAQFSEYCDENEVPGDVRLYALDTVLDVFSKMGLGESGLFMAYADQVEAAEFNSEESQAEQQAMANFRGYLKSQGLDK